MDAEISRFFLHFHLFFFFLYVYWQTDRCNVHFFSFYSAIKEVSSSSSYTVTTTKNPFFHTFHQLLRCCNEIQFFLHAVTWRLFYEMRKKIIIYIKKVCVPTRSTRKISRLFYFKVSKNLRHNIFELLLRSIVSVNYTKWVKLCVVLLVFCVFFVYEREKIVCPCAQYQIKRTW